MPCPSGRRACSTAAPSEKGRTRHLAPALAARYNRAVRHPTGPSLLLAGLLAVSAGAMEIENPPPSDAERSQPSIDDAPAAAFERSRPPIDDAPAAGFERSQPSVDDAPAADFQRSQPPIDDAPAADFERAPLDRLY
jgi:hypothetical protein